MIDRAHRLPVKKQCQLLEVARSSIYYRPKPPSEADLALARRIDEIHLEKPFLGSRRIQDQLDREGIRVNRKRIQRLMRQMGLLTVYPKRRTSQPGPGHKIYPYLLRDLTIDRPNQVWAADICYIPMAKGSLYLVVIMDWASRKVLSWELSNTADTYFCLEALERALGTYGRPEIFNTDQGAQFTSNLFTNRLQEADIRISMDGRGRWLDNVFVERLWRSLKYEEVYLKAYETVAEARRGIALWFAFYNSESRHQALDRRTPDEVYAGLTSLPEAA